MIKFIKALIVGIIVVPMVAFIFALMLYVVTLDIGFIYSWANAVKVLVTTNPFSDEGYNIRAYLLSILVIGVLSYLSMEE
ncbi:hypothetical protein IACHDJAJ_00044 [Aeromonas phage vB_AdhS_TS3]|nr:hypothetical protein IACHDJAJ_00044 [Aeromonas phage vB_AdhS_TS3]